MFSEAYSYFDFELQREIFIDCFFSTCSEANSYFDLPFCPIGGKTNSLWLLVCCKISDKYDYHS